jgi:hypothetical protein
MTEKSCPRQTPWGPVQNQKRVADGVWVVDTAGHGGYWLSLERRLQMPEDLRNCKTWTGEGNWFEEDCDWSIVACAFPELFEPYHRFHAVKMMMSYHKETWAKFRLTEQGKKLEADAIALEQANLQKFEISSLGSPPDGEKGWGVTARRMDKRQRISWVQDDYPSFPGPFTIDQIPNPRRMQVFDCQEGAPLTFSELVPS